MESLLRDLGAATRTLRRTRRFAVPALATLALAAGFGLALLTLVHAGLARAPELTSDAAPWGERWSSELRTLPEVQAESLDALLRIVGGATLLVLLIASINLGLLLAARAAARHPEVTLRAALGAGRLRLTRQLLTEVAVLALLGGLAGFLVFGVVLAVLHATWPAALPRWLGRVPSTGASAVALLLPLLAAVGGGMLPLRSAMRSNLTSTLAAGERATPGPHEGIMRRWVVTVAVASSVALLVSAGLLLRSFASVEGLQPRALGYDPRDTLTLRLELPPGAANPASWAALAEGVGAVPGVRAVGLASEGAWAGLGTEDRVEVICGDGCFRGNMWLPVTRGPARHHLVSPGYFAALGVPLQRGREFSAADGPAGERVAVVSQTFAYQFFLGQDPLGKAVRVGGPAGEWFTVVGVAGEVRARALGSGTEPVPALYLSLLQQPATSLFLAARTEGNPTALAAGVEAALRTATAAARLGEPMTLEERLERFVQPLRWFAGIVAALAAFGALVAALGLFGVVSYTVGRRSREIGVRMALGARAAQVVRMVIGQCVRLAMTGLVLGVLGVLGLARLLQLLFLGVRPLDPVVYGIVGLLLVAVALLASLLPARRAARVDPRVALRHP